jgi:hypothetical protein
MKSLFINWYNFRYSELLNTSNQILYSSMCNIQLNNETYMQLITFTHTSIPSIQLNQPNCIYVSSIKSEIHLIAHLIHH